jgi:multidrug efflux pump subunit AcrA (membrane-fusion protein)
VDVKGRALEGKGFAQEGKGELDAATATYTKLAELSDEGFKVASLYHRARVLVAQQQKDKAKELLLEARTQLEKAKLDARVVQVAANPYRWLDQAVEEALLRIDPSAVPAKPPGGMPNLPDDIKRKLQEQGINPALPTP